MKLHILFFIGIFSFGSGIVLHGQIVLKTSKKLEEQSIDTVHSFKNASFETLIFNNQVGVPDWSDCGFKHETPPTIHIGEEIYNVKQAAHFGKQYISMVTREHDTWEGISQKLDTAFLEGNTYRFSVYLAISEMESHMRFSQDKLVSFDKPVTLRVWGGNEACQMIELLYTSPAINHKEWMKYEIEFTPEHDMNWISIQSFFVLPTLMPYNGNILVDKLSPIIKVSS
jgi:hypothetical protein